MKSAQDKIREIAAQLLSESKTDLVIGFTEGSLPMKVTPCFITEPNDAQRLVWNSYCSNNLAVYLRRCFATNPRLREQEPSPKIAIVVKGCDGRSTVGLINEQQVLKENLLIIAAPCDGMLDAELAQRLIGQKQVISAEEHDGTVTINDDTGKQTEFDRKDLLAEACRFCTHRVSPVSDITIGELPQSDSPIAPDERFEEFLKKSTSERWEQFCSEFSKCILCNACRSACPNCYCRICFADQTRPNWTGSGAELHDVISYHLGRIFHQAGRCVDCGACARACPMDVDLRTFTYKLVADAEELFGHVAGLDIEQVPLLRVFKPDDSDNFITEPE